MIKVRGSKRAFFFLSQPHGEMLGSVGHLNKAKLANLPGKNVVCDFDSLWTAVAALLNGDK